eukprot:m.94353 g.94353  ORF g.94353 m.94353 type:complete len:93 (+) comp13441_c0_seq2:2550-2828(+)
MPPSQLHLVTCRTLVQVSEKVRLHLVCPYFYQGGGQAQLSCMLSLFVLGRHLHPHLTVGTGIFRQVLPSCQICTKFSCMVLNLTSITNNRVA